MQLAVASQGFARIAEHALINVSVPSNSWGDRQVNSLSREILARRKCTFIHLHVEECTVKQKQATPPGKGSRREEEEEEGGSQSHSHLVQRPPARMGGWGAAGFLERDSDQNVVLNLAPTTEAAASTSAVPSLARLTFALWMWTSAQSGQTAA